MSEISLQDIEKIIQIAEKPRAGDLKIDENVRLSLMQALGKLKTSFETPLEATFELAQGPGKNMIVRVAIDMGIFNAMAGGKEVGMAELTASNNADPALVVRVMRFLSAINLTKEVGPQRWAPLPLAGVYADGSVLRDAVHHFFCNAQAMMKIPFFLQETKYKEPTDAFNSPWQYTYGTKKHLFDWYHDHPDDAGSFNRFMRIIRLDSPEEWFDFFPVDRLSNSDPERPLYIDMGGGFGHDIIKFEKANPNLTGKLILQDLPSVIAGAKERAKKDNDPTKVEMIGHDFFTPQPVKNAKAYYLRGILHDWPNSTCLQILGHIRAAMAPDSLLLVNETVTPEKDAPVFATWLDFMMMGCFSALERTHTQWLELLDEAGFDVVKVWEPKHMAMGQGFVFEAKAKQDLPVRNGVQNGVH